jgi:hypothetical protein
MCFVDVSGVPSLQGRLRIEATWQVTKKILNSLAHAGSYNTTPLASRAYDATSYSDTGPGLTNSTHSDVFDKTIKIPADCPMPDFVFSPVSSDHVTTLLEMTVREGNPECCSRYFSWLEDLYQPMIYAPVTLKFINCVGIIEEEVP